MSCCQPNNYRVSENELFEQMKSAQKRFWSYKIGNWPVDFMSPKELAEAGFFYLMNRDRVQCAFCRGVVCGWEPGDKPLVEHERHFARCPFLLEYNVGNIPLENDCSKRRTGKKSKNITEINELKRLGVHPHTGPDNKDFASLESRARSFTSKWLAPIEPRKLAEAGFYFQGTDDNVKCFYCGGGLCNWKAGETPWTEHSRWFPECKFINFNMLKFQNDLSTLVVQRLSNEFGVHDLSSGNSASNILFSTTPETSNPDNVLCKICVEREIGVVFLPCGHFAACTHCALRMSDCPICRANIKGLVRSYLT